MSQSAKFWSFREAPPREAAQPKAAWKTLSEQALEAYDAGWDCGSLFAGVEDGALGMDVSDVLEDERLEAWRGLLSTMAGDDAPAPWITRLGSGDGGDSGVVAPAALAAAVRALRDSGALEAACEALEADGNDASGLTELGAFLGRAADAGAWVVWRTV